MAGPYNISDVTYTGTDPDPVEWANGQIKPAITDLDLRVQMPHPMIVGRYYTVHAMIGNFNSDANVFGTTGQRIWLTPMFFAETTVIDRFAQGVAQSGNGTLLMGLYDFRAALGVVDRLVAVSTDASTGGDKYVSTSATISPGWKLAAIGTTDTTGSLRVRRASLSGDGTMVWGSGSGTETDNCLAAYMDGVNLAGGLPATLNLSTMITGFVQANAAILWVRRSG